VNEVKIMNKVSLGNKLMKKALAVLVAASMMLPGTVYAKINATKIYESGQEIGPGTYYNNLNYITPNGNFMVNMLECDLDAKYLKVEVADGGSKIVKSRYPIRLSRARTAAGE
jgi:hypothetical protein